MTDDTSGTDDTSETSDTDKIPVPQRTEVERKPRIAHTIRILALPIVIVWVLLAVGVNVFVPQLEKVAEEISVPLSPTDAPSVTGMKHIGEKFKEYDSDNLVLVTLVGDKPLGQDAHQYYDDLVKKIQARHRTRRACAEFLGAAIHVLGCRELRPQGRLRPGQSQGDQGGAVGDKSVAAVRKIVADSKPPAGVKAYVAGQGALTADTIVVGDESLAKMTIITIIIIAIMLMFVYRSIGTVLLTMVILFVGLATGRGVVALLGETGIMGLSTFAVNLLTSLAIAAGTDYAIFMVGRYQEGRERGLDREAAYYDTFAGVTKVVLGSGLTIVGALACLRFTRLPYFNSLAFPCAVGLLVVVAAGVTLTPALIAFASGFGLFDPKREFNYTRWRRLATAIVRWPAPILAISVILAIVGALGLMGFTPRYNDLYYLPQSAASVQAYNAADQHFTQARLNPDLLMIESDHDLRNPTDMLVLDKIAGAIFRVPGIERVQSITRPLGPPIEDGSIPFQLSVQSAPIRDNLSYLKARIGDIKKITELPRRPNRPTRAPVQGDPGSRERGGRQRENHGGHRGNHGRNPGPLRRFRRLLAADSQLLLLGQALLRHPDLLVATRACSTPWTGSISSPRSSTLSPRTSTTRLKPRTNCWRSFRRISLSRKRSGIRR